MHQVALEIQQSAHLINNLCERGNIIHFIHATIWC
jgi:hypothetical protein